MATTTADCMKNPDEVHDRIYQVITDTEEISWKQIIMDLIKQEDMDPWDINISTLTKRFINAVKKMKEMNLKVSGKVILAAALLLRIKSTRLIGEDVMEFDRLLASTEDPDLYDEDGNFIDGELGAMGVQLQKPDNLPLVPRTPQPRKRKVSVYDLIDALDVALHVKKRRVLNQLRTKEIKIPDKKLDITRLMDDILAQVIEILTGSSQVAFSTLVPSDSKHDKVLTFIPLLHLKNARKIALDQPKHFEEIWVTLGDRAHNNEELKADTEPETNPQ